MKPLITLLSLFAFGLGAFGYWGVFTHAGRRRYDEMAGFIPGIALLISAILFFIILVLLVVSFFKGRKKQN